MLSNHSSDRAQDSEPWTPEYPHYLLPSFDPQRATVSELKSILLDCGVEFPTHRALKEDYVVIFNEKVASKSKQLMQSMAKIKPSSHGIQLVHTSPIKVAMARIHSENATSNSSITASNEEAFHSKTKSTSENSCALGIILGGSSSNKDGPKPLPIPPHNPQSLLHPGRLTDEKMAVNLAGIPPMATLKASKSSVSLKGSRLPKLSISSPQNHSSSSGSLNSQFASIGTSLDPRESPRKPLQQTYNHEFTSSPQPMSPEISEDAKNSVEVSVTGESVEVAFTDDENDSDYSDVIDAYEKSPSPSQISPQKPHSDQRDDAADDDDDVRFSPDPRRSSSTQRDRRSTSPRSNSSVVQSSGSPLLTKHLKQRLRQNVMETVRRRSSLGGEEIRRGRNLSVTEAIKAVESDGFDSEDEKSSNNQLSDPLHACPPNLKEAVSDDGGKPVRVVMPCLLLFAYALLVPPLLILITWYLETGATIQFCGNNIEPVKQLSEVITAKDLMNYLMPSCIACPEGALCHEDRILGCAYENQDTYFEKPKAILSAFQLAPLCSGTAYGDGNDHEKSTGISIQQPTYSRTKAPLPSPTVSVPRNQNDYFGEVDYLQNATRHMHEKVVRAAHEYFILAGIALEEISRTFNDTFYIIHEHVLRAYLMIRKHELRLGHEYNRLVAQFVVHLIPPPEKVLLLTLSSVTLFIASVTTSFVFKHFIQKRKNAHITNDEILAHKAASEVLQKLQERAEKIRRQSILSRKKIDVSVRLDQVKDLVLPTNAQRQRRISRGGDVDEKETAVVMMGEERRENVWKLVRNIVLKSGLVEEMEVDGVEVWYCS